MERCNGVILDLGGVIVIGNSGVFYREIVGKHNLNIDYDIWRTLYKQTSSGAIAYPKFIESLASKLSIPSAELEVKVTEAVFNGARIAEGAYDILLQIKKLGLRSAILTNNIAEWVNIMERKFHFKSLVDAILVSSSSKVRKPAPKAYIFASMVIDRIPQQLCYIGDEDEDIRGARSVGMKTIFIAGEDKFSEYCDYRIWNLREILKLPILQR